MRPVHQCSLYSLYLEPMATNPSGGRDFCLSGATGFLFRDSGQTYLVSNYHVLSGRNAETDQPIDIHGRLPSKVKVYFLMDQDGLPELVWEYSLVGENGEPLWRQHPDGGKVDVAALAISPPPGNAHFHLDEIQHAPGVGEDLFCVNREVSVIGFPIAIRVGGRLPIWKRSVIASEPFSELAGNPKRVLIDTGSRPGMSGSPVVFAGSNLTRFRPDGRTTAFDLPSFKAALGIYSGRIAGADEFAAQLGIVWSMQSIVEVLRNPR